MANEKMVYQAVAAAGAGTICEYAKSVASTNGKTMGALIAGGIAALSYAMSPTARGTMLPVWEGAMMGAASWAGSAFVTPVVVKQTSGFGGYNVRSYYPPATASPAPAFGGGGGVSGNEL